MRLRLIGPLGRVTGSCYELCDDRRGLRGVVDCGLRQGDPDADAYNRGPLAFDPGLLDFVVLTHAHIDHCGLLPRLVREGFRGPVWCTRETAAIATVSLLDAARHEGASFGADDVHALRFREPKGAWGGWSSIGPGLRLRLTRAGHIMGAVSASLAWGDGDPDGPAGRAQSITFSGDLGEATDGQEHHPLIASRRSPGQSRYAVVESTYGDVWRPDEHCSAAERLARLDAVLRRVVLDGGGVAIIPCFAVGRVQDLLIDLAAIYARHRRDYAAIPVFLDAPMGAKINRIYGEFIDRRAGPGAGGELLWLGEQAIAALTGSRVDGRRPSSRQAALAIERLRELLAPAQGRRARPAGSARHWRPVHQPAPRPREVPSRPAIVVTSGGMCDGGPVQFYLAGLADDPRACVVLNGWAHPDTAGGALLRLLGRSLEQRAELEGTVKIRGAQVPLASLRIGVERLYGYSAHADQRGLLDWLFPPRAAVAGARFVPGPELGRARSPAEPDACERVALAERVFLTHGEPGPRQALADAIAARAAALGLAVQVEQPLEDLRAWFDLDQGRWIRA